MSKKIKIIIMILLAIGIVTIPVSLFFKLANVNKNETSSYVNYDTNSKQSDDDNNSEINDEKNNIINTQDVIDKEENDNDKSTTKKDNSTSTKNNKNGKNSKKNTSNSSTNKNSNSSSNSSNSNNGNNNSSAPEKTIRERIQAAYAKASGGLANFKNQLNGEFGAEGVGYRVVENGNTWMIEILSANYIEVMNSNGSIESYLIPERDCGAVGNGSNDDTAAIKTCLDSNIKNIVLRGTYLISNNIETYKEKNIFNGNFLIQVQNGSRALSFRNIVRMNGTSFTSYIKRTGTSPHGETFNSTSNIDFVEVWGREASFINCKFNNALRAIRGRISTGSTAYPETLYINNCEFIDSKAPVQGYFVNTVIENSYFKNNGDLYSGDHAVYLEAASTNSLIVRNSRVETYNTESGAAFQTYGKRSGQSTPKINIVSSVINANGIVSADLADVSINNTSFVSQHTNRNAIIVESGSVLIDNSKINHNLLMARYPNTLVIAKNTEFKLNNSSRAIFPTESINCTFINWGGYVVYPVTKVTNSIFTRDTEHVVGKYYIGVGEGNAIYVDSSAFKAGDNIAYNSPGTLSIKNSYFTNNIGINVPNVILEGNINRDVT